MIPHPISGLVVTKLDDQNSSTGDPLEERMFFYLALAYAAVAFVANVQLIRIQLRVPEYGWTTQKIFHLLNFVVNTMRAVIFFLHFQVLHLEPKVWTAVLLDTPGLIFFTTYVLLVLFWAEIYHQAKNIPSDDLRPCFVLCNVAVYLIQGALWLSMWLHAEKYLFLTRLSQLFCATISLAAASGFIVYGGRLFVMLGQFPIESRGRRKKLQEVGFVTGICFSCFLLRSLLMLYSSLDKEVDLDVMGHPTLNVVYYLTVELLPSALVLYILKKLPPRRTMAGRPGQLR